MIRDFRIEIVEAEKGRTDLLKWKLILVATLGAIGLGIKGTDKTETLPSLSLSLVLCLIPLVCVYVDLLCKHLQMRILVIGNFFQTHRKEDKNLSGEDLCIHEYEKYAEKVREVFDLEDWAQNWSTYIFSALIIVAAFFIKEGSEYCLPLIHKSIIIRPNKELLPLIFSGLGGIFFDKNN